MSNTVENKEAAPKKPGIFASIWNGFHKVLWGKPSPTYEKYYAEKARADLQSAKTEGQKNRKEIKTHANANVTRMLGYVNKISMHMGTFYPEGRKNFSALSKNILERSKSGDSVEAVRNAMTLQLLFTTADEVGLATMFEAMNRQPNMPVEESMTIMRNAADGKLKPTEESRKTGEQFRDLYRMIRSEQKEEFRKRNLQTGRTGPKQEVSGPGFSI